MRMDHIYGDVNDIIHYFDVLVDGMVRGTHFGYVHAGRGTVFASHSKAHGTHIETLSGLTDDSNYRLRQPKLHQWATQYKSG
jgi:hypothetical protein